MIAPAPLDAEELVARALAAAGIAAGPTPVPDELGETLPYAVVTQVGGSRSGLVVDAFSLSVDVYAQGWAEAMGAAREAAAVVASLELSPGEVQWRASTLDALPYANPDPERGDLARATFAATVVLRAELREI